LDTLLEIQKEVREQFSPLYITILARRPVYGSEAWGRVYRMSYIIPLSALADSEALRI
jgi:hypothetical protein